jgi:hypothetical protein
MSVNKILLYQYGKVGSSSITQSIANSKYVPKPQLVYNYRIIQTHNHNVAEDVIKKHPDVLVIVLVRLPVTRNLSDFWENIHKNCPFYKRESIQQIDRIYKQKDFISYTDHWMDTCFRVLNIDKNKFKFNHLHKFRLMNNKTQTLFIRYEDLDYISKVILPQFGIRVNKKTNVSSKKVYGKYFLDHKKYHTIDKKTEDQIRASYYHSTFYDDKELLDHIQEWSESSKKHHTSNINNIKEIPSPVRHQPPVRQVVIKSIQSRVIIGMGGSIMSNKIR